MFNVFLAGFSLAIGIDYALAGDSGAFAVNLCACAINLALSRLSLRCHPKNN